MLRYSDLVGILAQEGFSEVAHGLFAYSQPGASPWLVACPSGPDGYVDIADVLLNLQKPIPYLDIRNRLVRRLESWPKPPGA